MLCDLDNEDVFQVSKDDVLGRIAEEGRGK